MRAVIPYKKTKAKSRLSSVLTLKEREEFVESMLKDVVNTLSDAQIKNIDVLTTTSNSIPDNLDVKVITSEHGLNEAINSYLKNIQEPVLIIMADLPLVKSNHITDIINTKKDVVIVPGKGGGTNILYLKKPEKFTVKYYGSSFLTHCNIAKKNLNAVEIYDSFLASTDIDEPHDLVEILLHGQGLSRKYIEKKFEIDDSRGRLKLKC
ncbi:2-phospho-L-lactate guanylyltransferase CofC [Methanohalobium evestigatum Z-7303]|uniref:2-phospho-L-lactate guanylyltransferase n=1 Tax=Methanohalobium evestigatum (strain ATCC BAA-1072 / DSM 3721 / NBRC 107634 / OCM 161 / Z-7303) TaxID=644295 RepID=D7E6H0_METEZ|nr:2-phospho-L-lactate guanylyltransferase [Methanohalobium evestigatum]ADI73192.1 2-phospho-L-lactate guanylyltransferase CofC [Methanohalobium evestigatum Z-7303]